MIRIPVLFILCCTVVWADVTAQQNRILSVEDWRYEYIERLQRRGHLLSLNPTALPYLQGEVVAALQEIGPSELNQIESRWVALLTRSLAAPTTGAENPTTVGAHMEGGARIINSDRLDLVRPLGDTLNIFPYQLTHYWLDAGPIIAAFGLRHDVYYDRDPDGLDAALRLIGRSENTYVGYNSRLASVFLGRYSHHWAAPGDAATLISDNARSFDQINVRIGGKHLAVRSFLGELDSVTSDGRFTGRTGDLFRGDEGRRRFIAAHRWDWRPTRTFSITVLESALYSGAGAGVSLKYLNPLHPFVFVVDNIPKNDENNGFIGGLLWAQVQRWTLHGQVLFDDLDLRGEGNERPSFSLSGSLVHAQPVFDVGTSLEVVAARTYNAAQVEGKYLYLLRGLATQFSDYVQGSLFADVYLDAWVPGLRASPRLTVLAQGDRDIRQPFPASEDPVDTILNGTVERTVRPALQLYYQPMPWWWLRLDGGVNMVSNKNHIEGASETRFAGQFAIGVRLRVQHAFGN